MIKNLDLSYFRHNFYGGYFPVPKRHNDFSELTLVIKGNLHYVVDGEHYYLNEGDALYVESNTYTERLYDNKYADYVSFNFRTSLSGEFFKTGIINNCITAEIKSLINLCDANNSYKTENFDNKEKCIISLIIYILQEKLTTTHENKIVAKIKKYVNDNLDKHLTLKEIGEALFFSPAYCDTLFKRETGTSIIAYSITQKIELAKKLLSEGVPLKSVSMATGFTDYNYFSRLFKRKTGYSPHQFKKIIY
ncbi:MAG: AraC family transcriptional regulator [Clostridia bacterium]|nr:AraC family transcriptional regulator [Clostridia bacterium]